MVCVLFNRETAKGGDAEEGCIASAYTVMLDDGATAPPEEVDFVLDRPFLFAIVSKSGQLLFAGMVNYPL